MDTRITLAAACLIAVATAPAAAQNRGGGRHERCGALVACRDDPHTRLHQLLGQAQGPLPRHSEGVADAGSGEALRDQPRDAHPGDRHGRRLGFGDRIPCHDLPGWIRRESGQGVVTVVHTIDRMITTATSPTSKRAHRLSIIVHLSDSW